jgi:hypothetical protein
LLACALRASSNAGLELRAGLGLSEKMEQRSRFVAGAQHDAPSLHAAMKALRFGIG